jgi:NHL repeat
MPRIVRLLGRWPRWCAKTLVWVCLAQAYGPVLPAQSAGSYLITTVAGSGSQGFGGDGGPAATAQLWGPQGVAVDASGNLFIADSDNQRIRRVTPQGTIITVAGGGSQGFSGDGGPAVAAQLWGPQGVAADASGNLFIADSRNQRIRRVTPQGTITTVAGSGSQGFSGDGGPAVAAQLWGPQGVAVDASGSLFIADI